MIRILFDAICKITLVTLLLHLVSICSKRKDKNAENTSKKPSSPVGPPGNPYPAWRGRQKPMQVFDDKPSEASSKSSKIIKSQEESVRTKALSSCVKTVDSGSQKEEKSDESQNSR